MLSGRFVISTLTSRKLRRVLSYIGARTGHRDETQTEANIRSLKELDKQRPRPAAAIPYIILPFSRL